MCSLTAAKMNKKSKIIVRNYIKSKTETSSCRIQKKNIDFKSKHLMLPKKDAQITS